MRIAVRRALLGALFYSFGAVAQSDELRPLSQQKSDSLPADVRDDFDPDGQQRGGIL